MHFTLFAPLCEPYVQGAMLGRAHKKGIIDVAFTDPRDFTTDVHRTVDDGPFGGGAGMVMLPEPLALAVEHVRTTRAPARVVLMSPSGRPFTQQVAKEYAALGSLALVCGRYEGIDERVSEYVVDEEGWVMRPAALSRFAAEARQMEVDLARLTERIARLA